MADTSTVALVLTSSVLAAGLTQAFAVARDWWKRRRDAGFSALYVALTLEDYVAALADRLGESENFVSSGGHAGTDWTHLPDLPAYSDDVDWKSLGLRRTTEALAFRVAIASANAMIAANAEPGDEDLLGLLFREQAAELGVVACRIAADLRKSQRIRPARWSNDWSAPTWLAARRDEYQRRKNEREARDREWSRQIMATDPAPQSDQP